MTGPKTPSNSPKVTVLTTVYNSASFLAQTISNIQSQNFGDWEYVLVDDASADESVQIIENAMRLDPRIRLVRQRQNSGCYVAANAGLRESRGQYIFRMDADDLSAPHRIQRQLQFMAEHPKYRACISFWRPFNSNGFTGETAIRIPERPQVFKWYLLLRNSCLHSSVCVERTAMMELGGYRELQLSQDYRLWCDLTQRNWLGIIPEVLSYVRKHEMRQTRQNNQVQHELAMEVVSDHLFALTNQRWLREELDLLRAASHCHIMPVSPGLAMIDRWDSLWRADTHLDAKDREDLARVSLLHRWRFLKANGRQQPLRVLIDFLKLGAANPTLVARGDCASWIT